VFWLSLLLACGPDGAGEPCACDGHGVQICQGDTCGPCMCLPLLEPSEEPDPASVFWVDPDVPGGDGSAEDPWAALDWDAVDAALAGGHVRVNFSALEADEDQAETWPEPLDLHRGDGGEHRLVLDGSSWTNTSDSQPAWVEAPAGVRARVPGISTGYDDIPRSRITVRGFEVTGSADKGIYVRAGDEVIIEDNLVHDNAGSPSISLDYVSRTGLPSSSFVVRNNHVWNQRGECIYIGGAEGEDLDAHGYVLVENNLVHDCWKRVGTHHDGINIKDRIGQVQVRRNVIFNTDWGIEAASPGLYAHNLVWSTARNAYHFTDGWGEGLSGLVLEHNVAVWAGHAGLYLSAQQQMTDGVSITGFTAVGSGQAGVELGAGPGLEVSLSDPLLVDNAVGLDGWGGVDAWVEGCQSADNGVVALRDLSGSDCTEGASDLGSLDAMAGPDGVFFTADDPWLSERGGAGLPAER